MASRRARRLLRPGRGAVPAGVHRNRAGRRPARGAAPGECAEGADGAARPALRGSCARWRADRRVRRRGGLPRGRLHLRRLGRRREPDDPAAAAARGGGLDAARPSRGVRLRAGACMALGDADRRRAVPVPHLRAVRGAAALHHPERPRWRRGHLRARSRGGRAWLDHGRDHSQPRRHPPAFRRSCGAPGLWATC